jgi:WD40 repeat protein
VAVREKKNEDYLTVLATSGGKFIAAGELLKNVTIHCVVFHPEGKIIATGETRRVDSDQFEEISLWSASSCRKIKTISGHRARIHTLAFSPDGKKLAAADDLQVRLWDLATGKLLHVVVQETGYDRGLAFRPDGRAIAAVPKDAAFAEWDAITGKRLSSAPLRSEFTTSIAYSPNGRFIASSFCSTPPSEMNIVIWDRDAGQIHQSITGFNDHIYEVTFSHDGKYLAYKLHDAKSCVIWDIKEARVKWTLPSKTGTRCLAVMFHPRKPLCIVTELRDLAIWDISATEK